MTGPKCFLPQSPSATRPAVPYLRVFLLLTGLAIPFTGARAQEDEALVKYRQMIMKTLGVNMGAIGAILKNKLPFTQNIATHAKALQAASTLAEGAFEKKITEGKTDAKPEIWQQWEKFAAAAKQLGEESGTLAEIAQSGDGDAIGAQVKKVGEACGACHKPFRKPKEERFQR